MLLFGLWYVICPYVWATLPDVLTWMSTHLAIVQVLLVVIHGTMSWMVSKKLVEFLDGFSSIPHYKMWVVLASVVMLHPIILLYFAVQIHKTAKKIHVGISKACEKKIPEALSNLIAIICVIALIIVI
ncbi:MAG: hypothetical protein IKD76_01325 [Clostridia bacterium]|nr:hypothetical protein [Clostridia bacterium]